MSEFHFLRPYWLLMLLPILTIWWGLWRQKQSRDALQQVIDPHLLEHLLVGEQKNHRLQPIHLLLVILALSAVALAGPTWRKEPSPFADDKAGLVIVLKVSGTMEATDVQPSRLERAKHKIGDLLKLRQGASTGLIVYSGSAHLVMPLTRDARIITAMIEDLTPELMPAEGDTLAAGLELADQLLQKSGLSGSVLVIADSTAPSQVEALSKLDRDLPVQFLAMQSPDAPIENGLRDAAKTLNASVEKLSVDQSDVERLARRAETQIKTATNAAGEQRWQDAGYALLPLIALGVLMWSRKGWLVR